MKQNLIASLVGAALVSQTGSAIAQNAPTPAAMPPMAMPTPPSSAPRDPLALPGDNLPPSLAAAISPPRPPAPPGATPPAPPAPRPAVPGPSMEVALEAAQAALGKCRADGLRVGVAVSDSLGMIVVGMQMTGANPGRIYNAARKNLTAIEFGTPTSEVQAKLRARDFDTLARVKANMTLFSGAVPLMLDGKAIGAIGTSGATSAQDEACSAAGAAAIAGKLK
jgi:uncharacterized protein GlcG (DUF336 family)